MPAKRDQTVTGTALTAALLLFIAAMTPIPTSAQCVDPGVSRLEAEIARLAALAGGTVGVGAVHLETNRRVYLNGGEAFPMASTYKVPIAVQLFTRIDRGEIGLDTMIALRPSDLHPGSGTLTALFDDPGVILSLRNLTELMLLISDNSATDLVLRTAGGPEAVTARMEELGFSGIRVNRPTLTLIANWVGVERVTPEEWHPDRARELFAETSPEERARAADAFDADPRDTATPEDMAELLAKLWQGDLLTDESTQLLLGIMTRSTTGTARLKGLLPRGTEVAHKTGTIGRTTNDIGIITLPNDAGHVVTVVFVKESEREIPERERAIAHIARAVHDYFLFNPR